MRLMESFGSRLERRWQFTVTQGQMAVSYIIVTSAGRNHAAIEIGTAGMYPELLSYSGADISLTPSGATRQDQLDLTLPRTTLVAWPARWRGWDAIPEHLGRSAFRLALLRPGARRHVATIEVTGNGKYKEARTQ